MAKSPDEKHRPVTQNGPYCTYHGGVRNPASIDWIVIHDAEGASAKGIASYGASGNAQASWHFACDNDNLIRCLADDVIAWHAYSPANQIGLAIELAGYASWSKLTWFRHQATLKRAAWQVARWAVKYNIPARILTKRQLKAQLAGITFHVDITKGLGVGSHTDPGPNFPRGYFMFLVRRRIKWIKAGK